MISDSNTLFEKKVYPLSIEGISSSFPVRPNDFALGNYNNSAAEYHEKSLIQLNGIGSIDQKPPLLKTCPSAAGSRQEYAVVNQNSLNSHRSNVCKDTSSANTGRTNGRIRQGIRWTSSKTGESVTELSDDENEPIPEKRPRSDSIKNTPSVNTEFVAKENLVKNSALVVKKRPYKRTKFIPNNENKNIICRLPAPSKAQTIIQNTNFIYNQARPVVEAGAVVRNTAPLTLQSYPANVSAGFLNVQQSAIVHPLHKQMGEVPKINSAKLKKMKVRESVMEANYPVIDSKCVMNGLPHPRDPRTKIPPNKSIGLGKLASRSTSLNGSQQVSLSNVGLSKPADNKNCITGNSLTVSSNNLQKADEKFSPIHELVIPPPAVFYVDIESNEIPHQSVQSYNGPYFCPTEACSNVQESYPYLTITEVQNNVERIPQQSIPLPSFESLKQGIMNKRRCISNSIGTTPNGLATAQTFQQNNELNGKGGPIQITTCEMHGFSQNKMLLERNVNPSESLQNSFVQEMNWEKSNEIETMPLILEPSQIFAVPQTKNNDIILPSNGVRVTEANGNENALFKPWNPNLGGGASQTFKDVPKSKASYESSCSLFYTRPKASCRSPLMEKHVLDALKSTWNNLNAKTPESIPFRDPVDGRIWPAYYNIIKNPTCLGTIDLKLTNGDYEDPWEYINEVWLMFENAWTFNHKKTFVHGYARTLSEVFKNDIDPVMKKLGYCCGLKQMFYPDALRCSLHGCSIFAFQTYYENDTYQICKTCFVKSPIKYIKLKDEDTKSSLKISKKDFNRKVNNVYKEEPFVKCISCGRKNHIVCVLCTGPSEKFICSLCYERSVFKEPRHHVTSEDLEHTPLTRYIEQNVNTFLKGKQIKIGLVRIRLVINNDCVCVANKLMKNMYLNNGKAAEFPYKAKLILAFQEVEPLGEVCFFAMQVQEYGSDCPEPNTGRIYISYIDSVYYFRPKLYRTETYHEIFLSYIDYKRQLGYRYAHVWACPPHEGKEYIFYHHPPEQKMPKVRKLTQWYKILFQKGIQRGVFHEFHSIVDDQITSPVNIPYFDGDLWPDVLEGIIESYNNQVHIQQSPLINWNHSKDLANNEQTKLDSMCSKELKRHKNDIFTLVLHEPNTNLPPICETDQIIKSQMATNRDDFFVAERDFQFEFSTLRRAILSTLRILQMLYNERQQALCKTCNSVASLRCSTECDFTTCTTCVNSVKHEHDLIDIWRQDVVSSITKYIIVFENFSMLLEHLFYKCDRKCENRKCVIMRHVVMMLKSVVFYESDKKLVLEQFLRLCCFHAMKCRRRFCTIPFCRDFSECLYKQTLRKRASFLIESRWTPKNLPVKCSAVQIPEYREGCITLQKFTYPPEGYYNVGFT